MAANVNGGINLLNQSSVGFVPTAALGPGILGQFQANVQHPFDRMFFMNTANLAGQAITFFQTAVAGTYIPLNGVAANSITKTAQDTNWDQQNQAQYSYLLTGMYLKFQTLTQQSFLAAPLDLTTWADYLRALCEDSSIAIVSEDNTLMRQKSVHIPEGNAVTGFTSATSGALALTAIASQPVVHNGAAFCSNVFSFGQMALWVPKTTRFNVNLTFGNSLLAANAVYLPTTPTIFAEVRFQGIKLQAK